MVITYGFFILGLNLITNEGIVIVKMSLDDHVDDDSIPDALTLYDPDLEAQYGTDEYVLNQARKRLAFSTELSNEQIERITEFDRKLEVIDLKQNNRKGRTRALYVDLARILERDSSYFLDCIEDEDEKLNSLLSWVNNQHYAQNSIHKHLIVIKIYGEVMGSDDVQDRFEEIVPGRHRKVKKTPLPGNVLEWEDAIKMAEAADNSRDRAMPLVAWGSGARPESEFGELQYKHLEWRDDHYVISIPSDSKTGSREVRLYPGAAALRQWIEVGHPVHADPEEKLGPDTYIFTKINKNEPLRYNSIYHRFFLLGDRADIIKDHNPQHFRRSRASYLASKPTVNEQTLRDHFGWSYDSTAPKHYIKSFSTQYASNIAYADGGDGSQFQSTQPITPIKCDCCGGLTERYMSRCICCSAEVDTEAQEYKHEVADPTIGKRGPIEMLKDMQISANELDVVERLKPLIKNEGETLWENIHVYKAAADSMRKDDDDRGSAEPGAMSLAAAGYAKAKHTALKIHPDWTFYTPSLKRLTATIGMMSLYVLSLVTVAAYSGLLADTLAAEPMTLFGLLMGLAIGTLLVLSDLPTVDEALTASESS